MKYLRVLGQVELDAEIELRISPHLISSCPTVNFHLGEISLIVTSHSGKNSTKLFQRFFHFHFFFKRKILFFFETIFFQKENIKKIFF